MKLLAIIAILVVSQAIEALLPNPVFAAATEQQALQCLDAWNNPIPKCIEYKRKCIAEGKTEFYIYRGGTPDVSLFTGKPVTVYWMGGHIQCKHKQTEEQHLRCVNWDETPNPRCLATKAKCLAQGRTHFFIRKIKIIWELGRTDALDCN
jgi:hypothetical protein